MAHKEDWENEEDKKKDNEDINETDDSFGLPDVSYEPLDDSSEQEEGYGYASRDEEEGYGNDTYEPGSYQPPQDESRAPLIITFIVITLLVIGGGAGYFLYYVPQQEKKQAFNRYLIEAQEHADNQRWDAAIAVYKKAQQIEANNAVLTSKLADVNAAKLKEEEAAKRALAEEQAAKEAEEVATKKEENAAPGTIQTITSGTGRYYVVVASAVDGDLANDFAKKLADEGKSPKIIEPFNNKLFYRVALSDFEDLTDAQTKAEEMKGEYGDEVWVIRY